MTSSLQARLLLVHLLLANLCYRALVFSMMSRRVVAVGRWWLFGDSVRWLETGVVLMPLWCFRTTETFVKVSLGSMVALDMLRLSELVIGCIWPS